MASERYYFGRSQGRRWSVQLASLLLWTGAVALLLLLVQAVARENLAVLEKVIEAGALASVVSFKLLDVNTAFVLTFSVFGLLVARSEYAKAHMPETQFSNLTVEEPPGGSREHRHVSVLNAGTGRALIEKVSYRIDSTTPFALQHDDLETSLRRLGLVSGVDFQLRRLSAGASIPPGQSVVFLEADIKALAKRVTCLDIRLDFRGVLGHRFRNDYHAFLFDRDVRPATILLPDASGSVNESRQALSP
jgi:hypothetical protein